jgi:hypothetical protein
LLFPFLFATIQTARSGAVIAGTRRLIAVLRCLRRPLPVRVVALFFVGVSILSCPPLAHPQDTQGPASSTSTRLRGTVINNVTREPVARALVFSPDNRFAKFTDDQGRFEFQLSRIDSVQLMARKPGFLEGGSAGPHQPQSAADDMTITLIPESLIVGRVNLPSSNQFDRVTVEVYRRQVRDGRPFWAPVGSASTRSNGEFRVANLPAGTYKVFTDELLDRDPITFNPGGQLYGYPPIYYPAASDFASASAITLEAGKTLQVELTPVLQPYYRVKISVTNIEAGSALNVSVALDGHKGPGYSLGYTGESSVEGMLPNGTYTVEASVNADQQTATGSLNLTVKGAPLTNASMAAIPGRSIPVNIRDEQSEKGRQSMGSMTYGKFSREAKADVSLQLADEFDWTGFATLRVPRKPHDNDLVMDGVRPGRYWLQVNPYFGYVASAVAGSVDLLRQPLVVGPGGTSLPIDIVLRDDGATIDGTVEGLPTAPAGVRGTAGAGPVPMLGGAYVYCIPMPDSAGRFAMAGISAEGTFQFQQLPPGVYRVLAFDRQQDELEYRNAEAMSIYEGKGPVVRLVPGQTEQVRIPLISTQE